MTEITILEILLISILLSMPILSAYLAWRIFRLRKTVKLLRIDRNDLLEERSKQSNKLRLKGIEMDEAKKKQCSDIMFRTIKEGETVIGELLFKLEKRMILNALNMPGYKAAIDEPSTHHHVRKAYKMLKEKIKDSMKE